MITVVPGSIFIAELFPFVRTPVDSYRFHKVTSVNVICDEFEIKNIGLPDPSITIESLIPLITARLLLSSILDEPR